MFYLPRWTRIWVRRHSVCVQRTAIILLLLIHGALLLR